MTHALVTIIAPLALDRVPDAEAAIDAMENPAQPAIAAALDATDPDGEFGTHFASLHAIRSQDGTRAYLVLEFSADGTEDQALARIVTAIGVRLRPVFMLASDWRDAGELLAYMRSHRVAVGCGWTANPGVAFAGTPRMTVGRIRREARLAARVTALLKVDSDHRSAMAQLDAVRDALKPEFAWALDPGTPDPPFEQPTIVTFAFQLLGSFAKTYLWPLLWPIGLLLLVVAAYAGWRHADGAPDSWVWFCAYLVGFLSVFWKAFWVVLLVILIFAGIVYNQLRKAEATDSLEERAPDRKTLNAIFERENRGTQNHMISVTQRKPGFVRWFTARLVFWAVGEFAANFYRPGFLSDIGTIHFARWVTAPDSRDLMFFSNYDGSWESYLEDFITRAHAGLTAVWSNSVGFPRAQNLFQDGATDGERFKRYARHSMIPTRFWYSAYPDLSTTIIRTNAQIRLGLSGAMTEDDAINWLALFGSAVRPASKLVSSEIQSLIFGGLGFLPCGICLLYDLPQDVVAARRWLTAVRPLVAFNDGRRLQADTGEVPHAVTLALGPRALARLGLPAESLETFPFAFLEGMTSTSRARILGDDRGNARESWAWGYPQQPDAALLVYGKNQTAVDALEAQLRPIAERSGMAAPHRIPLQEIRADKTEAFGFVDGISQPVIRGTYKGLRNADPIHLVEPGEFILGYPDNRGNLPPGPTMPATADPKNQLPLVETSDFARTSVEDVRNVGFNGSFLVIRQLEQNVDGFKQYCEDEATKLAGKLPPPYNIIKDFIAAKLVGRWPDGASLLRHPYDPPLEENKKYAAPTNETARERSNPASQATPIERPAIRAHVVDAAIGKADTAARSAVARNAAAEAGKTDPEARKSDAEPAKPPALEARHLADNDFLFGTEDPEALRCPLGAHIRRANPRDSLDPGSNDQIDITNRHRIMRVGRRYAPEGKSEGLLFMCLNGDIERQFEFVQQTWINSPSFHGLSCEKDPLLGDGEAGKCGYTIPSRQGPLRLSPVPQLVTMKGGGYYFMPGKRLIDYLSVTE
jgi:deferrochelatase/peroxidase EfeB